MHALAILAVMFQAAGDAPLAGVGEPTAVHAVEPQEINLPQFINSFEQMCGRVLEGDQFGAALGTAGWEEYKPHDNDAVALEVAFINGFASGVVKGQGGTQALKVSFFRQITAGVQMVLVAENVTVNFRQSRKISGPRCTLYALGKFAPTALPPITEWVGREPTLSNTSLALQSASWNASDDRQDLSFKGGDINFSHQISRQPFGPTLLGLRLQTSLLTSSDEEAMK
jgi:hypothetical protein